MDECETSCGVSCFLVKREDNSVLFNDMMPSFEHLISEISVSDSAFVDRIDGACGKRIVWFYRHITDNI